MCPQTKEDILCPQRIMPPQPPGKDPFLIGGNGTLLKITQDKKTWVPENHGKVVEFPPIGRKIP